MTAIKIETGVAIPKRAIRGDLSPECEAFDNLKLTTQNTPVKDQQSFVVWGQKTRQRIRSRAHKMGVGATIMEIKPNPDPSRNEPAYRVWKMEKKPKVTA